MRNMNTLYTVLAVGVLVAVFAGFYELRRASTDVEAFPPPEVSAPLPKRVPARQEDSLSRDFHDKNVSPVDYAAQVNAHDMTEAPSGTEATAAVANGAAPLQAQGGVPVLEMLKIRADAEKGNPYAQGAMGEMYHYGKGVERDLGKAFYWFRLGAKNGDRTSRLYKGRYYKGEFPESGVGQDLDKAENVLRPAAIQGDSEAMLLLATVLQEKVRTGEKEREEEAKWWYNRAMSGEWDEDYVPPAGQPEETGDTGDEESTPDGEAVRHYP